MNVLRTRRRKAIAILAVLAVAIAATAAYAAWFVQDVGEGKTRNGTISAITVAPGNTVPTNGNQCYPGNTCDAHFQVTNPASNGALVVTAVAATPGSVGTTNNPACAVSNLTVEALSGLAIPLPTGTTEVVVPDAYRLSASAPNDCQGAVLTREVTLTASTP